MLPIVLPSGRVNDVMLPVKILQVTDICEVCFCWLGIPYYLMNPTLGLLLQRQIYRQLSTRIDSCKSFIPHWLTRHHVWQVHGRQSGTW